jgi:hypothetical protein
MVMVSVTNATMTSSATACSSALLLLLAMGCSASPPADTDFASFFPPDASVEGLSGGEVALGESLCLLAPESSEKDLSVAGQVLEMSWDNLWPGNYIGDIEMHIYDWCGTQVDKVVVQPSGSFAFHTPAGEHGFVGYFEYPYKPDNVAQADWEYADYPLFREFDKEFRGDYIHCNLRLFGPEIISLPLNMTKQKDDKGYIQGTLYEIISYETLAGAVITPSSGTVTYLSDSHLPDGTLTETRELGLFLIANTEPGPVELIVTLANGNTLTKVVYTWPLKSEPNMVITNVGIPVMPELL